MRIHSHVILGGAAAALLYPVLGPRVAAFFAASVLIDIDHYMDYVYHNGFKDFSLKGMFAYHDVLAGQWQNPAFLVIEVFHTVEFLLLFYGAALALGSSILMAMLWGMLFHIVLDAIYMAAHSILFKRSYSFTEYFLRRRRLGRKGLRPGSICREAARGVLDTTG
jgi:hypothetical protein